MQSNTKNIIELKDVSFRYNSSVVLERVSFSVKEGEYLGIIGPNGGGKTTLLKIILGLLRPAEGEVSVNLEKSEIGYVPQRASQYHLRFPATVEEIVRSGRVARLGLFGRFGKKDAEAVDKALEMTGLSPLRRRLIGNLSGGEIQKVFLARAFAGEPKTLILDEPEVGIDIAGQEEFYTFLDGLNQKLGLTVIFVSHDIELISHSVKSVLCLNRRLLCHGSPREFIKEEYIDQLYGKKVKFIFHEHRDPASQYPTAPSTG